MARKSDQKAMVLERLASHLLATGLARTSLRDLAEAAAVSDRMLIYYFTDKTAVLSEAIALVAGRLSATLAEALPEDVRLAPAQLTRRAVEITTRADLRPYMRVWIEIVAAAARKEEPYVAIAQQVMNGFRAWIESRLELPNDKERADAALAIIAICDGLALVEICSGGEALDQARAALPLNDGLVGLSRQSRFKPKPR